MLLKSKPLLPGIFVPCLNSLKYPTLSGIYVNLGTLNSGFSDSLYGITGFKGKLFLKVSNGEPVNQNNRCKIYTNKLQ